MNNESFYHFLMTLRNLNGSDDITLFANNVFYDQSFPKHSKNYYELSNYLELNGSYLYSMDIFDRAWNLYLDKIVNY